MSSFNAFSGPLADQNSQALDIIKNLTCETSGLGDLLRSEFSHTCIPAPFFDAAIASILSPGLYLSAVLKLKINDEYFFPQSCTSANRIDPGDPKISFAFCNDIKLATATAEALAAGTVNFIVDLAAGKSVSDAINNNFSIQKEDYHIIFTNKKPGDQGVMMDAPFPLPWKVVQYRDQICVATVGIAGWMNVGCRYMKEPYPDSIYDINPSMRGMMNCSSNQVSCYDKAKTNASTMTPITSPIINCIREMLLRLMVNPAYCGEDGQTTTEIISSDKNIFFKFQQNMYQAVSAFLTLYVIFVGFTIVLGGELPEKGQVILYALKIILVVYFAVGINTNHETHGFDGMTDWIFPIMFDGSSELANWLLNASDSGLCTFNADDYNPAIAGSYNLYSIWDALDCRLMHYLGLNFMSDNVNSSSLLNFSVPPYILLLIPAVYTGSIQLIMLILMYPILVISVAAYFVNSFAISMITIVILGVMAPIFIPMVLFEFTKGYFTSWYKLMLSFILQPAIVATFLIVMFSVYDQSFYNSCKYNSFKMTDSDGNIKKTFFINTTKADYSDADFKACLSSLGGLINFPLALAMNVTLTAAQGLQVSTIASGSYAYESNTNPLNKATIDNYFQDISFLQTLAPQKGIFFSSFVTIFEFIKDLILSMFTGCVILYLMYHFSEQLSEFAADITEGASLGSSVVGAKTITDKANETGKKVAQAIKNAKGGGKGGGGGGK